MFTFGKFNDILLKSSGVLIKKKEVKKQKQKNNFFLDLKS